MTEPTLLEQMEVVTGLWAQLRLPDRARYLERAAQAVIDEFDDLCLALASESQRPRTEVASLELLGATDALRWLARDGRQLFGAHRLPLPRSLHPLTRASAGHAPVGVVGVRGAPGAPFAQPLAAVGAALLAGNGAILVPAGDAHGAGQRAVRILARAGVPEGLVRVEAATPAGVEVVLDYRAAAGRGADVMIVLADANLRNAASGALWGACAGAGRMAGSVKRVYVARECHARFLEELVGAARELVLGDPLVPETQLGPLPDEQAAAELEAAIAEAVSLGAVVHCGGRAALPGASGALFAPVVLTGVPAGARLARERVAGPVLVVAAVADSVEAVALANAGEVGIGASIWSSDRRAAVRIARELRARYVWGNDHLPVPPARETAAGALARCTRPQVIAWDPPSRRPPWRYPYDAAGVSDARALAELRSSREGDRERALRDGVPAVARVLGRTLRD